MHSEPSVERISSVILANTQIVRSEEKRYSVVRSEEKDTRSLGLRGERYSIVRSEGEKILAKDHSR